MRKFLSISVVALLLTGEALCSSPEAMSVSSDKFDTISLGNVASSAWKSSEFDGVSDRTLYPNRVVIDVQHNHGGFDASLAGRFSSDSVDEVSDDFAVNASLKVAGEGDGLWWYGPKISVNWVSGNPDGMAGWYENYIVETAKLSAGEMHDWIMHDWETSNPENVFLGTTEHDGAIYKHYKVYFSTWVQFWAVRQDYRYSGTTSIKPVLSKWRAHGLENLRVDGIKFNVETHKQNYRTFTITQICMPESFIDDACKA